MYATIVECDLSAFAPAAGTGYSGRTLATALSALPGFVAFVALDLEAGMGTVAALCLVEERAALEEAERVIARWQREHMDAVEGGTQRLGAGEVIAQKGL
jgi:hypothetical protein